MPKGPFPPSQFVPTAWSTATEKAALRDDTEFLVHPLPEAKTLKLLRRSMGRTMADSQPHPNDVRQGEQR